MSDYGSGKSGGRPTVGSSLTLDLQRLFKMGWLKPGAPACGTLRWTRVDTGREIASIGFLSDLSEENGYVQLHWTSTDRRPARRAKSENRITLTTRLQPFGGRSWFFVCSFRPNALDCRGNVSAGNPGPFARTSWWSGRPGEALLGG